MRVDITWKGVVNDETSEEVWMLKGNQSSLCCPEGSVLERPQGGGLRLCVCGGGSDSLHCLMVKFQMGRFWRLILVWD